MTSQNITVSLIAAMTDDGVIGKGGSMPWHIPEELKMFRRLTTGHAVIMGRKTWESIGRPLPGRLSIVITRDPTTLAAAVAAHPAQVVVVTSLAAAYAAAAERRSQWGDEAFVIGGGEIYRAALPDADKLYLTRIHAAIDGDTRFPDFDAAAFTATKTGEAAEPIPYTTWLYERPRRAAT